MIEKGRRKTAPPDIARVKVHKYNLRMESNTDGQKHTDTNTSVRTSPARTHAKQIIDSSKSDYVLKDVQDYFWITFHIKKKSFGLVILCYQALK